MWVCTPLSLTGNIKLSNKTHNFDKGSSIHELINNRLHEYASESGPRQSLRKK